MTKLLTCAKAPCKTCPYRKDVPSGIWAESEYRKLPAYDADHGKQLGNGARYRFDCHQDDGHLCAGWVGTHGANNLISLRLQAAHIDPSVWDYVSPVPLFKSGQEACLHGLRAIARPGKRARDAIQRLMCKRQRKASA